jgi:hypothetical protein
MDYVKQAAKANPFEGLSISDKKKMVVYFHYCATPRLTDEEIYRRYGFVLPFEEQMYLGEEMRLAMQIEMELLLGNAFKSTSTNEKAPMSNLSSKGCLVPLLIGLSVLGVFIVQIVQRVD